MRAIGNILSNLPDRDTRNPILTKKLLNSLGDPDTKQRNILITGSKGKGSVSRMISKLLEVHGYKVGLFTSPHLVNFNERIRINGIAISEEDLIKYAHIIEPHVEVIEKLLPENVYIGPVGITSVIAMVYFLDCKTDFNVIECGKGARYDDVCMNESAASVINSIFLEHVPQLGNNIAEIAYNKAGVLKSSQKQAFIAEQQEDVFSVIRAAADELKVDLKVYGKDFESQNVRISSRGTNFDVKTVSRVYKDLQLLLLGRHQAKNAALAIGVVENFIGELYYEKVKSCLKKMTWPGRLEIINNSPLTVLDGCINRESSKYIKEILSEINKKEMVIIIGIPDDKDFEGVLLEFKQIAFKIILTTTKNQYLKFTNKQQCIASEMLGEKYLFEKSLDHAIEKAYEIISEEGMLLILGTQSLVREAKEFFNQDTTNLD